MAGNQWDGERIPGLGWMLAAIAVGLGEWVTGDSKQVTCHPCLEVVHA